MRTKIELGLAFILLLILSTFVLADNGHDEYSALEKAEALINSQIPCESLTNEELEYVGEYYMEQQHPGDEHERMDEMMGGHGSDSLREAHIQIAQTQYCGNNRGGMINGYMMGNGWFYDSIIYLIIFAIIFSIVFWITYKLVLEEKKK